MRAPPSPLKYFSCPASGPYAATRLPRCLAMASLRTAAPGLVRNCGPGRRKCIWRQKEFRGNRVMRFPVPFTGCLRLGKVVLQLTVLCVSLCGRDPGFLQPCFSSGNVTVARIMYFLRRIHGDGCKSEKDHIARKRYLHVEGEFDISAVGFYGS